MILENMTLMDSRNEMWRSAPESQEEDAASSTFLLLVRERDSRKEQWSSVMDHYGFRYPDGRPYLIVMRDESL